MVALSDMARMVAEAQVLKEYGLDARIADFSITGVEIDGARAHVEAQYRVQQPLGGLWCSVRVDG